MLQLTGSTQPQDWKGPPVGSYITVWLDFPRFVSRFSVVLEAIGHHISSHRTRVHHPKSPNLAPKLRFQPPSQQARWSEVTFSGTVPTARYGYTAVWSEAANGMYIFGSADIGSPVLGAAAGQRWRVPRPKDGRSCAEEAA